MLEKKANLIIWIIITVIGIFYISTTRVGHYWGGDFAQYIHHAKNISECHSYEDIGYIYNPHCAIFIGPPTYPPILPLLYAPVYKIFGLNINALKIELILFLLAAMFLIFLNFREILPFNYSALLLIIFGLNPYFWHYKDYLHLDFPFLFFLYLSLYVIQKIYNSNEQESQKLRWAVLLGISSYFCAGIKGLGMVLIISIIVYDLIRNKRVTRVTLISTGIFLILMTLQSIFIHNDLSYIDKFSLSPAMILGNFTGYVKDLSNLWNNGFSKALKQLISIVFFFLVAFGYYKRVREGISIFEIFIIIFMIPLLLYKFQYSQFIQGIIPILLFYAFYGFYKISYINKRAVKPVAISLLLFLLFISYMTNYTTFNFGPVEEGVEKGETIEMFDHISENTLESDVFVFWKPRVLSLYTGRDASIYHMADDDKHLINFMKEIGATYIISGPFDEGFLKTRPYDIDFIAYLQSYIDRNPEYFENTFSNGMFNIYRFNPGVSKSQ